MNASKKSGIRHSKGGRRIKHMKARKRFVISTMVALCGMATMSLATVHAEEAWYTCRVASLGGAWGGGYINLENVDANAAFTDKWFKLSTDEELIMQAIAITATGKGRTVRVLADIDLRIYPIVEAMELSPQDKLHMVRKGTGGL
jgi:hypothetical protein